MGSGYAKAPAARAGAFVAWRWRESNPRPPSPQQVFSGRSSLCLYSAPLVTRTSQCDEPSHCEMSQLAPMAGPASEPSS